MKARKLIEKLGGRGRVHRILQEAGRDITLDAIDQWRKRDHIPGRHLAVLANYAQQRSLPIKWSEFTDEEQA